MKNTYYKISLIATIIFLFFTNAFGKNCERMVYVYDIAVCVPNPASELFLASDGCTQQLLLNSIATNEFFSLKFQPMHILQSASEQVLIGPSQGASSSTDYLIWGELKATETGRYNIMVYLVTANTRCLVAKGTSTFEKPEEAKFAGMTAALSIGAGNGSRPMIDIITDFEKKIREEDKRKAICPELVYLNKEKNIKAEAEQKIILMFQVKDADDKPVENADVYVRTEEGTLDAEEAKTDQYGMVKFTHKTPDKRAEYSIHCFAKTTAPSEKIIRIEDIYIPVKVKKKVTKLVGTVEINEETRTGSPTISNPKTSKSTSQSITSSSVSLTIVPERITSINESQAVLARALSETDRFEIVSGTTMSSNGQVPAIINTKNTYSQYDKCEEELELSRSSQIQGTSNGFDIHVGIALERGSETGTVAVSSLSPRYCLIVTLGSNSRQLFQTSKYFTSGEDNGQKRDYPCAELTSYSDPLDPKSILPFEGMSSTVKVSDNENHEYIIPLSIANSKGLEQYLLNPQGAYTISATGSYRKTDNGELERKIYVRLTIWPQE